MGEYIGKLNKLREMLSDIVNVGNELITDQEYLFDQERIDTARNLFNGIDMLESIFKRYYYKSRREI